MCTILAAHPLALFAACDVGGRGLDRACHKLGVAFPFHGTFGALRGARRISVCRHEGSSKGKVRVSPSDVS